MIKTDIGSRLEKTALVGLAIICGATTSLLMRGTTSAQPTPTQTPFPVTAVPQSVPSITVSLPIDAFDTSGPTSTVIIEPVVTTFIDPSLNYIGFQGDFTFNETVATFGSPEGQKAGLTSGNWNVIVHVLPGSGSIRTA